MKPSRARHLVIVFAITLAIITYIDRVAISQSSSAIQKDLGLDEKQMGWVFFAFGIAYGLFELPCGWLGDRFGPRIILARVVIWWSAFTALTGMANSYRNLLACRFLFGAGEAGAFPNITKMYTIWLPHAERVRAQAITWLFARWSGAFTPLLVAFMLKPMGIPWRQVFFIFGGLGVVWAVIYLLWFRDHPKDHKSVNEAELALLKDADVNAAPHGNVPWSLFLRSRTVWLLCIQYFCMSYAWYFYITWLPEYLNKARGMQLADSSWLQWLPMWAKAAALAGIPLFFGGYGNIVSNALAGPMQRAFGSLDKARRVIGFSGLLIAGALLACTPLINDPVLAVLAMGLASFSNDLAMPGAWGACMDVGGKFAGSLSGTMNMIGNVGGAFGPMVVGQILAATNKNWNLCIFMFAVVYVIGAICWLFLDSVTPLEEQTA